MSQVIAGIYEIGKQIGAGGGGIVYLGRHLRLEKQVVLKADRRTLQTRSDTLRREVDMLKGLSHMYIPQVYDFVQQDGAVYTVMDFIEGESLDKVLERQRVLPQPEVIKWACQLLEALCYLHSRPPHGILHGDIKPANIMLRPGGDICLIDYNIALALGEDGAVKVGRSRGYASPEHYGAEFTDGGRRDTSSGGSAIRAAESFFGTGQTSEENEKEMEETQALEETGQIPQTEAMAGEEQVTETDVRGSASLGTGTGSTSGHRPVMLDVRSDLYSLGATLYHLLSGRRPMQNALDVEPLGAEICSPAVSAIIEKAMAPSPNQRYQSAEEMLSAFRQLHKQDKRARRHKRRIRLSAAMLSALFLAGGACSFTGLKQLEQRQSALALAEYSADRLAEGDVSGAVELALQAIPEGKSIFEALPTAQAQKALTDALGVYDLSGGFKALDTIELPSAPFQVAVSPQGTYFAAVYSGEAAVYEMKSGRKRTVLPIQNSALSDLIFVDENRIVFAGEEGVTAYDLSTDQVLWIGEKGTTLSLSGDGDVVAAVNRDEDRAVLYRMSDGAKLSERSFDGQHMAVAANDIFANPDNRIFSLNEDGSLLAVSFSEGGFIICSLEDPEEDLIIYDESDYVSFEGGFCGKYFAFAANKSDQSLFGLIDTKEAVYVGGNESDDNFSLTADERGIFVANGNLLVRFSSDTLEETELAYTDGAKVTGFSVGEEYVLVSTDDRSFSFYDSGAHRMSSEQCDENPDFVHLIGDYAVIGNRSEPSLRVMKLEAHEEAQLLSYDARYAHEEARISQDGRTAMLFDYQSFCIYDMAGRLVSQVELPDPEHIYDQQFEKQENGSWLEVIWYDGTIRRYSAADGALLSETGGKPPEKDLYEEFYTDQYRIVSTLHGAPEAYELESGRLAASLEEDSYLTYVTQAGEFIITEYISASGERYGLLLNDRLETLAYLPGLCDMADGRLVFDYESGNLRQCRLYSLQELKALGEAYLKENERERRDVR